MHVKINISRAAGNGSTIYFIEYTGVLLSTNKSRFGLMSMRQQPNDACNQNTSTGQHTYFTFNIIIMQALKFVK